MPEVILGGGGLPGPAGPAGPAGADGAAGPAGPPGPGALNFLAISTGPLYYNLTPPALQDGHQCIIDAGVLSSYRLAWFRAGGSYTATAGASQINIKQGDATSSSYENYNLAFTATVGGFWFAESRIFRMTNFPQVLILDMEFRAQNDAPPYAVLGQRRVYASVTCPVADVFKIIFQFQASNISAIMQQYIYSYIFTPP